VRCLGYEPELIVVRRVAGLGSGMLVRQIEIALLPASGQQDERQKKQQDSAELQVQSACYHVRALLSEGKV